MKKETAFAIVVEDLNRLMDKPDRRSNKKFIAKFKYLARCLNISKDELANQTMISFMSTLDERYKKLIVMGPWKAVITSIKQIFIRQYVDNLIDKWEEEGYGSKK